MRILIADDVPSARKVLRKLLARLGFTEVVEASNGVEGIEHLKQSKFDLIISDWQMPELDGIGLLNQLRELPEWSSTPVLFVTSSNEREQVLEALEAGVTGYLCKPFNLQILSEKIDEVREARSEAET